MVLSGLSTKGMNRAYKWILKLFLQSQTFRYVNTISSQFGLKLDIIFEIGSLVESGRSKRVNVDGLAKMDGLDSNWTVIWAEVDGPGR